MSFLNRINYIIIILITISLPIYLYFYYTEVSKKTYERDYVLIKEGDYQFAERILLSDSPIINENSIKEFISYSVVSIFNYRTNVAIRNLDDYEQYFSSAAFSNFRFNFQNRISEEIENGIVINEAVLETEPYYLGSYRYMNGFESRLYHIRIREQKIGETGRRVYGSFSLFVEIQYENFSMNGRGLSIRAIEVR